MPVQVALLELNEVLTTLLTLALKDPQEKPDAKEERLEFEEDKPELKHLQPLGYFAPIPASCSVIQELMLDLNS